jgi:hypothetical protein
MSNGIDGDAGMPALTRNTEVLFADNNVGCPYDLLQAM